MTLIDRWLWARHLKTFAVALGAICLLYCVIDFSDRSQAYTGHDWLRWTAALYANRVLKVAVLLSPVASLMACGLTVSALRRRSEWVALTVTGLSPLRLVTPLVLSALAIGAGTAVFNENIAVAAALKAEKITAEHFHLWGTYAAYFEPKRWVHAGSAIVHFGPALPDGSSGEVSIFQLTPDFALRSRIDADEASPKGGGKFELRKARVRTFEGLRQRVETFETLAVDLPGAEEVFGLAPGKPEMLSSAELARQVTARETLGLSNEEQRYEIAVRYAEVLTGAAGALVAAVLALRPRRRGHLNASLVEGIAIAGALWGTEAVFKGLSLAHRATPWVCAFSPTLLALAIGVAAILLQSRRPAR